MYVVNGSPLSKTDLVRLMPPEGVISQRLMAIWSLTYGPNRWQVGILDMRYGHPDGQNLRTPKTKLRYIGQITFLGLPYKYKPRLLLRKQKNINNQLSCKISFNPYSYHPCLYGQ